MWQAQLDWDSVAEIRGKEGGNWVELGISIEILRVWESPTLARFQIGSEMWVLQFMIEIINRSHNFAIKGYWVAK